MSDSWIDREEFDSLVGRFAKRKRRRTAPPPRKERSSKPEASEPSEDEPVEIDRPLEIEPEIRSGPKRASSSSEEPGGESVDEVQQESVSDSIETAGEPSPRPAPPSAEPDPSPRDERAAAEEDASTDAPEPARDPMSSEEFTESPGPVGAAVYYPDPIAETEQSSADGGAAAGEIVSGEPPSEGDEIPGTPPEFTPKAGATIEGAPADSGTGAPEFESPGAGGISGLLDPEHEPVDTSEDEDGLSTVPGIAISSPLLGAPGGIRLDDLGPEDEKTESDSIDDQPPMEESVADSVARDDAGHANPSVGEDSGDDASDDPVSGGEGSDPNHSRSSDESYEVVTRVSVGEAGAGSSRTPGFLAAEFGGQETPSESARAVRTLAQARSLAERGELLRKSGGESARQPDSPPHSTEVSEKGDPLFEEFPETLAGVAGEREPGPESSDPRMDDSQEPEDTSDSSGGEAPPIDEITGPFDRGEDEDGSLPESGPLRHRIDSFVARFRGRSGAYRISLSDRDGCLLYDDEGRSWEVGNSGIRAGESWEATIPALAHQCRVDHGDWEGLIRGATPCDHLSLRYRAENPLESYEVEQWSKRLAEAIVPSESSL